MTTMQAQDRFQHMAWVRHLGAEAKPWECGVAEHGEVCRKRIWFPLFWGRDGAICHRHMRVLNRI